ncbi:MAG: light-harvesting antenna LH1, beta subunit [Sphingomonadaceae bacterium]
MTDHDRDRPSTYLTPEEAKAFQNLFVLSMGFFVTVAVIAHILIWVWRPWFPGTPGYEATRTSALSPVVATQPINKA